MRHSLLCALAARWLAGACLLLAALPAAAGLRASLGDVRAEGWSASGIALELPLGEQLTATLQVASLTLPAPLGELGPLRLECRRAELSDTAFTCEDARARLAHRWLTAVPFRVDIRYRRNSGRLEFELRGVGLAGGRLDLRGHWQPGALQLNVTADDLDAAALAPLLAELTALPPLDPHGRVDLALTLQQHRDERLSGELRLASRALSLQNEAGSLASEDLTVELNGRFGRHGDSWDFEGELLVPTGQFYAEPVFLDAERYPLRLRLRGRQTPTRLSLQHFEIDQPGALAASGALLLLSTADSMRLDSLDLKIARAPLDGAYRLYLQPFLIGTPFDELRTQGSLSGELSLREGRPQSLSLRLDEIEAADTARERFALDGLEGELHWAATGTPPASTLGWRGGQLLHLSLGPARLALRLAGAGIELLEPARLPVLDGALLIDTLRARDIGSPKLAVAFDATLEPIALARLGAALGWPAFGGTLAGRVPSLTVADGVLAVGGTLRLQAFDGVVTVENLRIADPLGAAPRLGADIALRGLDLEAITDTFSFGRIEGRLDGEVRDLRLVNWRPEAFDARLHTPAGDRSRRRISQRAVQNISEIGGAGAMLSRGFLGLFQDFGYSRLGLSCRLRGDVCLMGGIAPASEGGYYIVRGGGLPRIDVIGHTRYVNWPVLLEQIRAATHSEGPVVR